MAVKTGETIHECDVCKKQSVALPISIDHKGRIAVSNGGSKTAYTQVCIDCMRSFREWVDRRRAEAGAQTVKWTPPDVEEEPI